MSTGGALDLRALQACLGIDADELDEDLSVALTSLIATAVHDAEPRRSLSSIVEAMKDSESASHLEPLTVIPLVVGSVDNGVDDLLALMAEKCSAKEVVMAVEEVIETLDRQLQSDDGEEEAAEDPKRASTPVQLVRLIRAYSSTIPRLPRWKKAPKDAVESKIAELQSVISRASHEASPEDGRSIISAISGLVLALAAGADKETRELLRGLLESVLVVFPNAAHAGLSRQAFATHFRRLIVPHSGSSSSGSQGDVVAASWPALRGIGVTTSSAEGRPTLASFILLAHEPSYAFSVSTLAAFFPVILSSIQLNIALDEVLSVLINTFATLRANTPQPELDTDLIVPLVHLLPHLASNHTDPDIRHYTFRILSLVLGLSPPPVRFQVLKDLLSDEDMPPQIRIAAVGLLKEAVLEGLSADDPNVFASGHLLPTFGPIVLQPDPPDALDAVNVDDFLDGPEPLRLVECLGLYYVLLQRDRQNKTGIRNVDSLRNVQRSLLSPLGASLTRWKTDSLSSVGIEHDHNHDRLLQLDILGMWLERVQNAADNVNGD
ncbi:hypothetical protein C8Q79DRAFT_962504 [Trametes meyenii]|nr:hypothetical protein C8Q79DRAFT_962504 [Trametes meyenii]